MTVGPVSGNSGFVHANLPSHAGKGEPAEPGGPRNERGENGNNGKVPGTGNGNGNGNDGVPQGNGPRTGGNNPASPEGNRGNEGPNANQGNQGSGNYGGPRDSGSMTTGGSSLPGLLDVAPGIARQLGNTLFSIANSGQNVLRDVDGRPEHRHVPGPPSHSNANASSAAGGPAPSANAQAHANAGTSAFARADGIPMPSGMSAPHAAGRAQGAFAAQGNAATGAATTTAAANTSAANTAATTMSSQATTLAPQQRAATDATLLAPNRPADAALAAGRTAATAPTTAPPPTTVVPPTLPNTPALPSGNTAALTAAGLTMATAAVNQLADARGVILPANDAVAAMRGDMLNPAGHTLDGAQRRSLRNRLQSMPKSGIARLLWAMGATGHTSNGEAGSQREIARAMQWLFWMLAIIAYGCLAAAIVIFMGSDGRLMDSMADRNSTTWLAMCGLATGVVAWGVARRISRRH